MARVLLSTYPQGVQPAQISSEALVKALWATPPRTENYRTYYGRNLDLNRIQQAIRSANDGYMREFTDLAHETMALDPHLQAIVSKRTNAVASLPWEVVPAEGPGVRPEVAEQYADEVRTVINRIPRFRQALRLLANGVFDGRAALEIQWIYFQQPTGIPTWAIQDLHWIHPRRLFFGSKREMRISDDNFAGGFVDYGLNVEALAPKFVAFKPQLFGEYPEREGLAPRCLYWAYFKRFGMRERMTLMELFGKPWRIIEVDKDAALNPEDLRKAEEAADALGGNATSVRMPKGTKLTVPQLSKGAGEVHGDVIELADKQMSKLVLGQTGTTDGQASGLNSDQAGVHQDEWLMILSGDADLLSSAIEDSICDQVILLNHGPEAVLEAPSFRLRAELPADRVKEAARVKGALDAGLELVASEVYEVLGFKQPTKEDVVVRMENDGIQTRAIITITKEQQAEDAAARAAESGSTAEPPPPGLEFGVDALEAIVKVNEARISKGLPVIEGPDGELTIAQFKEKYAAGGAPAAVPGEPAGAAPATGAGGATPASELEKALAIGDELTALLNPSQARAEASRASAAGEPAFDPVELSGDLERFVLLQLSGAMGIDCPEPDRAVVLAKGEKKAQPETVYGTLEEIIDSGVRQATPILTGWADKIAGATAGLSSAKLIRRAIARAVEELDHAPFAAVVDRKVQHSAMTGSLDSQYEAETDELVKPEAFAASRRVLLADEAEPGETDPRFTKMAMKPAAKYFAKKQPISKSAWKKLSSAGKARSFTAAHLTSQKALEIAHAELMRAIVEGAGLKGFDARLRERFDAAGFTKLNPSYVECVFRTNVVSAYNVGRVAEMSQPEVLRARPYWRVNGVPDARARDAHKRINGWLFSAGDRFWTTIGPPPWGFNERCRVSSVSRERAKGQTIHVGSEVKGLPDKGFETTAVLPGDLDHD